MSSNTVDYGIDLGTTNSAIAKFTKGKVKTYKNYQNSEITPSAVWIQEKGEIIVGAKAYEEKYTNINNFYNVAERFKVLMGRLHNYKFKNSNKTMNPEELSAEILKVLKQTAQSKNPDDIINACVITVPCNFEQLQCEATLRAAKLAGIEYAPLVQEPIAAAYACGFLEKLPDGFLAVYDLGGGTFDIALLSKKEGILSVVDNEGNNQLGGGDFDWLIVDKVIAPFLKEHYNLPDLSRKDERTKGILNFSKFCAEKAKIELSSFDKTKIILHLAGGTLVDNDGKVIDAQIPITRNQYESLVNSKIAETVSLFKKLLKAQSLDASDIEQLILVGGPTLTPKIRQALKDEFNIYTDYDIDPMTIVAEGAALVAHTQLIPTECKKLNPEKLSIDLKYKPTSLAENAVVGGKIRKDNKQDSGVDNIGIIIERDDGGWQSGTLKVAQGTFKTKVTLRKGEDNRFRIKAVSSTGDIIPTEPDEFSILQGVSIDNPPLPHCIGVELSDGIVEEYFGKNTPLPAKKTVRFYASKRVSSQQSEGIFQIIFREGSSHLGKYCNEIDKLQITGNQVEGVVEVHDPVDVTMMIDESRHVTAKAYFQKTGQEFKLEFRCEARKQTAIEVTERELQEIEDKVKELNLSEEFQEKISEIEKDIEAAKGEDPEAIEKAEVKKKEIGKEIFQREQEAKLPQAENEIKGSLGYCQKVIETNANDKEKQLFEMLKKDIDKAIADKDAAKIEHCKELLLQLYWSIVVKIDDWWIAQFNNLHLESAHTTYTNGQRAKELFTEGSLAASRKDIDTLKEIVRELWDLLPAEESSQAPPGHKEISNLHK